MLASTPKSIVSLSIHALHSHWKPLLSTLSHRIDRRNDTPPPSETTNHHCRRLFPVDHCRRLFTSAVFSDSSFIPNLGIRPWLLTSHMALTSSERQLQHPIFDRTLHSPLFLNTHLYTRYTTVGPPVKVKMTALQ